jgi:hypothetical protein
MIPEIKAERQRSELGPTPMKNYEKWKDDFDRWTGV